MPPTDLIILLLIQVDEWHSAYPLALSFRILGGERWFGLGFALVWPWFGFGLALVWSWFGLVLALVWLWFGLGLALVWPWFGRGLALVWLGLALV